MKKPVLSVAAIACTVVLVSSCSMFNKDDETAPTPKPRTATSSNSMTPSPSSTTTPNPFPSDTPSVTATDPTPSALETEEDEEGHAHFDGSVDPNHKAKWKPVTGSYASFEELKKASNVIAFGAVKPNPVVQESNPPTTIYTVEVAEATKGKPPKVIKVSQGGDATEPYSIMPNAGYVFFLQGSGDTYTLTGGTQGLWVSRPDGKMKPLDGYGGKLDKPIPLEVLFN